MYAEMVTVSGSVSAFEMSLTCVRDASGSALYFACSAFLVDRRPEMEAPAKAAVVDDIITRLPHSELVKICESYKQGRAAPSPAAAQPVLSYNTSAATLETSSNTPVHHGGHQSSCAADVTADHDVQRRGPGSSPGGVLFLDSAVSQRHRGSTMITGSSGGGSGGSGGHVVDVVRGLTRSRSWSGDGDDRLDGREPS